MRTITLVLLFVLAGCSSTKPDPVKTQRPALFGTVIFEVEPGVVYDEVFTLAFEQGYQIAYASQEEMMVEIDLPTSSGLLDIGTAWVHRIGVLVRDREGRSVLYVRYHSYDPEDGSLRAVPEDRDIAEVFLNALKLRLTPTAQP